MIALGFHGCKQSVARKVLHEGEDIVDSKNDYDWLGTGKYFWEANPKRAEAWAQEKYAKNKVDGPAVVGALIDLSRCFNLLEESALKRLELAYLLAENEAAIEKTSLPINKKGSSGFDFLLRNLDCAIVNYACRLREEEKSLEPYTTVRGVFWEGEELYANAGFRRHNHIQICVRDPKAVLCYFHPRCYYDLNLAS